MRKPYEITAQFYETDQMGIVHHSNYIRWFESARIDAMDQMGVSYKKMEETGIISPVLTVQCSYKKMTHFGDQVLVEVKIRSYNSVRLVLSYQVRDKHTGEVKAEGETSHCFLDRAGRPVSLKRSAPDADAAFRRCAAEDGNEQRPA